MKESRALRSSFVLLGCGRVATLAVTVVTVGVMTRAFGTSGYGEYRIVVAFLSLTTVVANLGTPLIISRELASSDRGRERSRVIGNAFSLRIVSVLIATAMAALLAFALPLPSIVPIGIVLGSIGFAALGASNVLVAVFQQYLRQSGAALADIAGALTLLALTLWIAAAHRSSVLDLVAATALANIATLIVATAFAERLLGFRPRFEVKEWKRLLVPAIPLSIAEALTLVYYRFDVILLGVLQPAAAVGLYGVGSKILDALMGFTLLFSGVLMPLMSRHASSNLERFRHYFDTGMDALIIALAGVLIVIWVYAGNILSIIAGPSFAAGAAPLRVLGVVALFASVRYMAEQAVIAVHAQQELVTGFAVAAVVGLIAYFSLIPLFDALGAALGLLVGESVVSFWTLRILFRRNVRISARVPVKVLISFALTTGGLEALKATAVPWYAAAPLGVIVYLLILATIRGIPRHVWGLVHLAKARDWDAEEPEGTEVME